MKVCAVIGFLLLFFFVPAENRKDVKQTVYYNSSQANEVFLVWNIKGCSCEELILPPDSYIKDERVYSPMQRTGSIFSSQMQLKCGEQLHYSFWITKGPGNIDTDLMDTNPENGSEYIAKASPRPLIVNASANIRAPEKLSLLNYSRQFLIGLALLFIVVALIRHFYMNGFISGDLAKRTLLTLSAGLLLIIFLIRPAVLGVDWEVYNHPLDYAPQLLWTGFYDLVYVAILTGIFLLLVAPFRRFPDVQFGMAYLFIAISLFSMIAGILNLRLLEALGKPSAYQWMYHKDLFSRAGASLTLPDNVSTDYVLNLVVLCMGAVIAGAILFSLLDLLLESDKLKKYLLVFSTFLCVSWVVVAQEAISMQDWKPGPSSKVSAFLGDTNPIISGK